MADKSNTIPIIETFISIQGEGIHAGVPYYFVRVGGCPLRCNFCDSEYTWKIDKNQIQNIDFLIQNTVSICHDNQIEWVSITGGEPLLYPKQLIRIINSFHDADLKVQIETSGRFYDEQVHKLCDCYSVDAKTPCTGESMGGYFLGIENLRKCDQVKCLIFDSVDLDFAYHVNMKLKGVCTQVLQPFNVEIKTDSKVNMSDYMQSIVPFENISVSTIRNRLCISYLNLLNMYFNSCSDGFQWENIVLLPQVHVMIYGNKAGV